ncbi:MAG: cell division protein FtsQ [Saprospiraceae bacterium]|jgi:cell division protein FtsQ
MFNISVKQKEFLKQLLLWGAIIAMVSLWVIAIQRTEDLFIADIKIQLDKEDGIRDLITPKDIRHMVEKGLPNDIKMQPIHELQIAKIEEMLRSDTRIYSAEVFIDVQQNLHIEIVQRRPIMRVMNKQGDQFYIDQTGEFVAQSSYRAVRVPVVTGHIESLKPNELISPKSKLFKAFTIVNQIRKDEFLSALVEQVYFEKGDRIILIPKVGEEKIVLDHIDDLQGKLRNLKVYYKEVAKSNSWGKYDEIDISYRKQVIGRNPVTP